MEDVWGVAFRRHNVSVPLTEIKIENRLKQQNFHKFFTIFLFLFFVFHYLIVIYRLRYLYFDRK